MRSSSREPPAGALSVPGSALCGCRDTSAPAVLPSTWKISPLWRIDPHTRGSRYHEGEIRHVTGVRRAELGGRRTRRPANWAAGELGGRRTGRPATPRQPKRSRSAPGGGFEPPPDGTKSRCPAIRPPGIDRSHKPYPPAPRAPPHFARSSWPSRIVAGARGRAREAGVLRADGHTVQSYLGC